MVAATAAKTVKKRRGQGVKEKPKKELKCEASLADEWENVEAAQAWRQFSQERRAEFFDREKHNQTDLEEFIGWFIDVNSFGSITPWTTTDVGASGVKHVTKTTQKTQIQK